MIPADLSARLRMLAEASFFDSEPPVQGTARIREIQARLPELLPGQRFTAHLQRALPDGTFQAVVAGRTYTLALNHSAKAGDTLELVVTQTGPRTVFAQLANQPANPAAAAQPGAANASLSATGRLISFMLTGQPTPQPAALAGGKPLLDAPPTTNGAPLAPLLRQALGQSGLFYESHQSRWIAGKLDMASLMREPQGQQPLPRGMPAAGSGQPLPGPAAGAGAQPAAAATPGSPAPLPGAGLPPGTLASLVASAPSPAAAAPGAPPPLPGGAPAPATGSLPPPPAAAVSQGSTPAAIGGAPAPALPGAAEPSGESTQTQPAQSAASANAAQRLPVVPERLMPIVHQQLDALATHTYVWQGQVWPGQNVEWEIEDPDDDESGGGDEAARDWNTTLRLTLPRLGGLEARLTLTPAGVALRLLADAPETVAALDAARSRLDEALAAAAVPLTGFVAEQRHGDE